MNPPLLSIRIRQFSPLVLALVGAVVAVCAYLQALHYPFISDDDIYIVHNHMLAEQHLGQIWPFFVKPYNPAREFLPLRDMSYWFDLTLFGKNPAAFRVHNILLYLLCLLFTYGATSDIWRYFRPADSAGAPWAAGVVTALFALHPAHAEAVVWIAGRKDVLSAMFSLLAIWLAVRAGRGPKFSPSLAGAALLALQAAMLSKATAFAVAPVIAMLWLVFWLNTPKHDRRPALLLWALACLITAMCLALVFGSVTGARIPFYFGLEAAARSLAVLGWLARLSVSPEGRHYFYPVFEDPYLPLMIALGVAVLATAITAGVMILRKRSLAAFALAVFLLLCVPSMQLLPYAPPSLVSDRFLALAAWPAILLIVVLSWRLGPAPRAALLLIIALTWTYRTFERPRDWRSPEVMADSELRAHPGYYMPAAHKIFDIQLPQGLYGDAIKTVNGIADPEPRNLLTKLIGAHYAVHVDAVSTGDPRKAIAALEELFLELNQRPVQSQWNAPIYYLWRAIRGNFQAELMYLIGHFPDHAMVNYNAGLWMLSVREYKDAAQHLRLATESQRLPESVRAKAFENLGMALLGSGQVAEAESPLLAALKQSQPNLRIHCLLEGIYTQTGRMDGAARAGIECSNASGKAMAR